jgi:Na+-transporting NADH:ubiquinone oxidoreductase subunit NqrD
MEMIRNTLVNDIGFDDIIVVIAFKAELVGGHIFGFKVQPS